MPIKPSEILKKLKEEDVQTLASCIRYIDAQLEKWDGVSGVSINLLDIHGVTRVRSGVRHSLENAYLDAGWSVSWSERPDSDSGARVIINLRALTNSK